MQGKFAAFAVALGVSVAVSGVARGQATSSTNAGIYTDAQATRGATAFSQNCAECHGASLGGNGQAPALTGAEFLSDWIGSTVGDLFDRIHTTMPQDNPGKLDRKTYADILAFILKSNGYPAGQKDLDDRSTSLKAISFGAPKASPHVALAPK
jgi:mono/diheme cytochrome c family protein